MGGAGLAFTFGIFLHLVSALADAGGLAIFPETKGKSLEELSENLFKLITK